jgi:hypothetical protein
MSGSCSFFTWLFLFVCLSVQGCGFCALRKFWLFLHISSSWVKIRLFTENQLPRLSGRGLKNCCGGGVGRGVELS